MRQKLIPSSCDEDIDQKEEPCTVFVVVEPLSVFDVALYPRSGTMTEQEATPRQLAILAEQQEQVERDFVARRALNAELLRRVRVIVTYEPVLVNLDESKYGHRKYNKGHRVEGVWANGAVEVYIGGSVVEDSSAGVDESSLESSAAEESELDDDEDVPPPLE